MNGERARWIPGSYILAQKGVLVTGEEGVPSSGKALLWPPPAEGEACPGQRELLSFGSKSH